MTAKQEMDWTAGPETKAVILAESIVRMLGNLGDTVGDIDPIQSRRTVSAIRHALHEVEHNIPLPVDDVQLLQPTEGPAAEWNAMVWGDGYTAVTPGQTEPEAV